MTRIAWKGGWKEGHTVHTLLFEGMIRHRWKTRYLAFGTSRFISPYGCVSKRQNFLRKQFFPAAILKGKLSFKESHGNRILASSTQTKQYQAHPQLGLQTLRLQDISHPCSFQKTKTLGVPSATVFRTSLPVKAAPREFLMRHRLLGSMRKILKMKTHQQVMEVERCVCFFVGLLPLSLFFSSSFSFSFFFFFFFLCCCCCWWKQRLGTR